MTITRGLTRGLTRRPLRALAAIAILGIAAGSATLAPIAGTPPIVHAQTHVHVYLPLVFRAVTRDELPPAPIAPIVPTAAPATATPTLDAPPTAPPTFTAIPSITPTPAGDGFIRGRLLVGTEPAAPGTGDGFGPGLFLLKCKEGRKTCERVGRTAVLDDEGHYQFQNPAPLSDDETYVVHWRNETYEDLFGLPEWLGAWYSEAITPQRYTPGAEITVEDFQLAPITLTGPQNGAGYQGLPWTFTWRPRVTEVGTYRWTICDCFGDGQYLRDTDKSFKSEPVGRAGAYTMNDYPSFIKRIGIGIEHKYFWYVHVDGPRGSWGQSYEQWMLWFIPSFDALRPFGATGFVHASKAAVPPSSRAPAVHAPRLNALAARTALDADDEMNVHLYLPLVWRGVDRDALPSAPEAPDGPTATRPIVATWTPTTDVPTEIPTAIATAEPTEIPTAVPSPTPLKPAAGTIHGRYLDNGTPLSPGFGTEGISQIELRMRDGSTGSWRKVANAVTVEDGAYAFPSPPMLEEDQAYQVWWVNDDVLVPLVNSSLLGRWYSRSITPDQMADGADVDLGTAELRDIELTFPGNDVHYSLPHEYRWKTRDEQASESYRWTLYKACNDLNERFPPGSSRTPSLGHVGKVMISSPPSGYQENVEYCWYVYIEDGLRGSGWSYYRYKTMFLSALSRALTPLRTDEGSTLRVASPYRLPVVAQRR
ncbi:MAG: hypothetical protein ABI780_05840 [Ardenticatenales bacterium]